MATWVQLWEAHRSAALAAYGDLGDGTGLPTMDVGFAIALEDSWVAIGRKALSTWDETGEASVGAAYGDLQSSVNHLAADSVYGDVHPLWNHSFAIASTLDAGYIAGPDYVQSFVDSAGDAVKYVKETAAAAVPYLNLSAILLAFGLVGLVWLKARS